MLRLVVLVTTADPGPDTLVPCPLGHQIRDREQLARRGHRERAVAIDRLPPLRARDGELLEPRRSLVHPGRDRRRHRDLLDHHVRELVPRRHDWLHVLQPRPVQRDFVHVEDPLAGGEICGRELEDRRLRVQVARRRGEHVDARP